jgi:hypothetical protein
VKHQYVGDINDFAKYAVLRAFASVAPALTVCWMLTEDDGGRDGRFLDYLRKPDAYRALDPVLFETLGRIVATGARRLEAVEHSGLLGSALFYSRPLTDNEASRLTFMNQLLQEAPDDALVFFDPDNGLEIASVPWGRKNSRRYLYISELKQTLATGRSAVVYQHLPRKPRLSYLAELLRSIASWTSVEPFAVFSSRVAFVVCAHHTHHDLLRLEASALVERSRGFLALAEADAGN